MSSRSVVSEKKQTRDGREVNGLRDGANTKEFAI